MTSLQTHVRELALVHIYRSDPEVQEHLGKSDVGGNLGEEAPRSGVRLSRLLGKRYVNDGRVVRLDIRADRVQLGKDPRCAERRSRPRTAFPTRGGKARRGRRSQQISRPQHVSRRHFGVSFKGCDIRRVGRGCLGDRLPAWFAEWFSPSTPPLATVRERRPKGRPSRNRGRSEFAR